MSPLRAARFKFALIIIAALALYLAGNQRTALFDRDEPRYAECSREMLQSGDWVTPRFLNKWRVEKPPMIYWLQGTAMRCFGSEGDAGVGSARLVSALAITAVAILLAILGSRVLGYRRTIWTVFIFCSSCLVMAAAKLCLTDATLLLCVVVAEVSLFAIWSRWRESQVSSLLPAIFLWLSLSAGILTKGPIILAIIFSAMIALAAIQVGKPFQSFSAWRAAIGWWRWTRPIMGIAMMALVVGPWAWLVHVRSPGFLSLMLDEVKLHAGVSMKTHSLPPGFHALMIVGTFLPWSLLLPATITVTWSRRRDPAIAFAWAAVLGPWIFMELLITKLPFYVLPIFPALAVLTADALVRCIRQNRPELHGRGFFIYSRVLAGAVVLVGLAPLLLAGNMGDHRWVRLSLLAAVTVAVVGMVTIRLARRQVASAAVALGVGAMVMAAAFSNLYFPGLPAMETSRQVAADLLAAGAGGPHANVAMIDYLEPSLAFYQGGGVCELYDEYFQQHPPDQWPTWLVSTRRWYQTQPQTMRDRLKPVGPGREGIHHGKTVEVMAFGVGQKK